MQKKQEGKILRTAILLGLVSMLNDISSEMIVPLLPIFILSLGGNAVAIGFVGGIAALTANLMNVISGYFADRIGKRKNYIFAGYAISATAKMLYATATSWFVVLLLRVADRIGKGLRDAPRDALLAESVSKKFEGRAFGIHRALDSLGALLGTLIAILLIGFFYVEMRYVFLAAGLIGFSALLPLLRVKETLHMKTHESFGKAIKTLSKELKFFLLITSIFYFGNFSYMFLILKAKSIVDSVVIILGMYAVFNLAYAIFPYFTGRLADSIGKKSVIAIAYGLFALLSLGLIFANNLVEITAAFFLYGVFYAFLFGNQRAFVAELAKKEEMATSMGLFYIISGSFALLGSIVAGFLWETIGPWLVFALSFLTSVTAAILLITLIRKN
ncbi:MAG: MFS transporter [Candidatus Diapherotrites archaeon]|nr:MFS transporter [Candidatus Diapherotrites archaeon]